MKYARGGIAAAVLLAVAGLPAWAADDNVTAVDPVQVTATRIPKKVSEQSASVSVVTREEIEQRQADVAGDALRMVPGIEVQRAGTAGNRENVRIRGGKSTHTLVMIDGFPVNSPNSGEFDIGALPAGLFERIEVVRGAQSALYGSNAMGGVVNFIPRDGKDGREAGLAVGLGSHDALKGNGFVQGGGRDGAFFLGADGFRSDGSLPNDRTENVSFLGSGNVAIGERNRLHAIVLSTDAEKEIPVTFGMPRDPRNTNTRRDFMAGARWETVVTKALSLSAYGSTFHEFFHNDDPADPPPGQADYRIKSRKLSGGLLARIDFPSLSTTFVGVEYEKNRADTVYENVNPFFPFSSVTGDAIVNRSVYIQEELTPVRNLGISLGARLDRNSVAGTQFNPRAAAYYRFEGSGIRVRAGAGRGFRTPAISEKTDPNVGNMGLTHERAVSYEAGADIPLPGRRGTVSATGFYQDIGNLIQYNTDPPWQLENVDAFARGVETGLACRFLPEVSTELSYTYTDSRDKTFRKRVLGIPRHRGTASLILSPTAAWDGRIDFLAESDQLDAALYSGKTRRPGFARLDAYTKYKWEPVGSGIREVALTGRVRNALNRHYEEKLDIPAPGIEFMIGTEIRL